MPTVSNPATLSSVKSVFGGGSPPNNLRSYLRGGVYVPDLTSYSGIASSGTLLLSSFAGKTFPVVYTQNIFVEESQLAGGGTKQAEVFLDVYANGRMQVQTFSTSGGSTIRENFVWLLDGAASNYEIYFAKTGGGTVFTGTVNTWLSLSDTRAWGVAVSGTGSASRTISGTIYIRDIKPSANLTANSVTLIARLEI